jgi:hypothetical protein
MASHYLSQVPHNENKNNNQISRIEHPSDRKYTIEFVLAYPEMQESLRPADDRKQKKRCQCLR